MANDYFDSADWTSLVANTLARAGSVNSPFQAVEVGFDRVAADIALIEGALATSVTPLTPGTGARNFTLQDARTLNAGGYWVRRAADSQTFMVVELAAAISASTTFNTTCRAFNDNTSTGPYTDWIIYGLGGTRNIHLIGITGATTVAAGHLGGVIEATGASAIALTFGTVASMGLGFWVIVRNASTNTVTLTRSGTDTFTVAGASGATSLAVAAGEEVLVAAGSTTDWRVLRFAPAIATQAQAEAGTDNVTRMTPLRTSQAISVLVPQATTSVQGKSELATTAETNTGTDTERVVTPAGLRLGVRDFTVYTASQTGVGHGFRGIMDCSSAAKTVTVDDAARVATDTFMVRKLGTNLLSINFGSDKAQLPSGAIVSGTHTVSGAFTGTIVCQFVGTLADGTTRVWSVG